MQCFSSAYHRISHECEIYQENRSDFSGIFHGIPGESYFVLFLNKNNTTDNKDNDDDDDDENGKLLKSLPHEHKISKRCVIF